MSFRRAGPAISSLGRAVSPGGGGNGLKIGDVRLFADDPGRGWLAEGETVPFNPKYAGKLRMSMSRSTINATHSGTGSWDTDNTRTRGVAYGAGKVVVGAWSGSAARFLVSDDFATFRAKAITGMTGTGSLGGVYDVLFAEGMFVGVGPQAGIAVLDPSDESVTNLTTSGIGSLNSLQKIQRLQGKYFLKVTGTPRLVSTDLVNWTTSNLDANAVNIVELPSGDLLSAHINNGTLYKSTNGTSWSSTYNSTISAGLRALAVHRGVLFGLGRDTSHTLWRSDDEGLTWTSVHQFASEYTDLVSTEGYLLTGWSSQLYFSDSEGASWSTVAGTGGTGGDISGAALVGPDVILTFERRLVQRVEPKHAGNILVPKPGPSSYTAYTKL